jgi:hypothetical protein
VTAIVVFIEVLDTTIAVVALRHIAGHAERSRGNSTHELLTVQSR